MEDNKLQKKKIREILHWIFGAVAVISLAVTLLLSPLGSFLRSGVNKDKDITSSTAATQSIKPTDPAKETKNYSLLIYKGDFISAESENETIIYAKDSKQANMTITSLKGTSYKSLCDSSAKGYTKLSKFTNIATPNLCSVYEKTEDSIIHRIYCIDDGNGSSIEIKYQYPADNTDLKEKFDILLSMFTVKS